MDVELKFELKQRPDAGFSLIEGLVAAAIVLIITLGIIPLIANSMLNTAAGRDFSVASQYGRSRMDQLYQLPDDSAELTIEPGEAEISVDEYWQPGVRDWTTTAPSDPAPWDRTTTIRQFNIGDLQ